MEEEEKLRQLTIKYNEEMISECNDNLEELTKQLCKISMELCRVQDKKRLSLMNLESLNREV